MRVAQQYFNDSFSSERKYLGDNEMLKLYWTLWAIIASIAALLLITGNFTMLALIAFGFVSFGMIFMGMISVLPSTVVHHAPPQARKVKPVKVKEEREERIFQPSTLTVR